MIKKASRASNQVMGMKLSHYRLIGCHAALLRCSTLATILNLQTRGNMLEINPQRYNLFRLLAPARHLIKIPINSHIHSFHACLFYN